jgi:hypothetical protein
LGGRGGDAGAAITVDHADIPFIGGQTVGMDSFPLTPGAPDNVMAGVEGFLSFLNPLGTLLLYSTFLGGDGDEAISATARGLFSVYVAGKATTPGLPGAAGTFDPTHNGGDDAFVSRFNFPASARCPVRLTPSNASVPAAGATDQLLDPNFPFPCWFAISGMPAVVSIANPEPLAPFGTPEMIRYSVAPNTQQNPRFISISSGAFRHNIVQAGANTTPFFTDVPASHQFFHHIQEMRNRGMTSGCAADRYCPEDPVTRGQMAVFIVRALAGDNFAFPQSQRFTDVAPSHPYFKYIQVMAQLAITSGCATNRFCPDDPVTRGQMAVFIARALAGSKFYQGAVSGVDLRIDDVPVSHVFRQHVSRMYDWGITLGVSTNPPLYGVDQPVTREQMAAFLMRAFSVR